MTHDALGDSHAPDDQRVAEALDALETKDSFLAVEILAQGSPAEVRERFQLACRELLTQRKLPRLIWISRAAVEFALREAERCAANAPDGQAEWLTFARKFSFNTASNLWPGWGDEAIEPTTSDLLAALDLARLHRRLVEAESSAPDMLANARWLIGALRLSLGQEQPAHHEFETAKAYYAQAQQPAGEAMAEGYVALALQLMGTMAGEGQRRFDAAVTQLRTLGDDGDFFADQLMTAKKVFLGTAPGR